MAGLDRIVTPAIETLLGHIRVCEDLIIGQVLVKIVGGNGDTEHIVNTEDQGDKNMTDNNIHNPVLP